jgi:hypothetical protein
MPHMDEGRLQAWLDGERGGLTEEERAEIEAYLAENEDAAALVADLRAEDHAARDLLGALAAAEPDIPDFSDIVARARTLESSSAAESGPARRRLPLSWAASVVLAVGVGWTANEVVRRDPRVVAPPVPAAVEAFGSGATGDVILADPVVPTAEGTTASAEGTPPPESTPPAAADAVTAVPRGVAVAENVVAAEPAVREVEPAVEAAAERRVTRPDSSEPTPATSRELADRLRSTLTAADVIESRELAPRGTELEAIAAGAAAIDAARIDPVVSVDGVRIDPIAAWRRTSTDAAAEALGTRPLRVEGLEWTEVAVIAIGEASVVRVAHETESGERVLLYQSRSSLEAEEDPAFAQLSQRHESGLALLAVAPFGLEGLEALLGEISPIG